MVETREQKVARIKAEEAQAAADEAKLEALQSELQAQGFYVVDAADRLFADQIATLDIEGGVVVGVKEIVAKYREKYPLLFQGPAPRPGGGTPTQRPWHGEASPPVTGGRARGMSSALALTRQKLINSYISSSRKM